MGSFSGFPQKGEFECFHRQSRPKNAKKKSGWNWWKVIIHHHIPYSTKSQASQPKKMMQVSKIDQHRMSKKSTNHWRKNPIVHHLIFKPTNWTYKVLTKVKLKISSRWFFVTFLSPIWRSLNLWRGHLTISKRSQRITWISKWLSTMVNYHPLTGVKLFPFQVIPLPFRAVSWLMNRGDPNYGSKSWDDPPSKLHFGK